MKFRLFGCAGKAEMSEFGIFSRKKSVSHSILESDVVRQTGGNPCR
ncbi:hypothetical protein RSSM_02984 [Rhodopirellula sallentina SM41]|uniref:Uncharacterized protein n=1 Tax=Rhodopirellula sallentina SM41 TaxID=1263870 RepID=M5U289_9BACT|nr:hypothetical protein RSSM_02984 [Rhodopirellula sallentina SM41]